METCKKLLRNYRKRLIAVINKIKAFLLIIEKGGLLIIEKGMIIYYNNNNLDMKPSGKLPV